jgi:hypothetical protein
MARPRRIAAWIAMGSGVGLAAILAVCLILGNGVALKDLDSLDPVVRARAAVMLTKQSEKRPIPVSDLGRLMVRGRDANVRIAAARALKGWKGDLRWISSDIGLALRESKESLVRLSIVDAMSECGIHDEWVWVELRRVAVQDSNLAVRLCAAKGLERNLSGYVRPSDLVAAPEDVSEYFR